MRIKSWLQLFEQNRGLEEKVREKDGDLDRLNQELEKLTDELSRVEKSRQHLLSNFSHDLRTPMTSIQGYVEAILDGVIVEPEDQRKYLKLIITKYWR